MTVSQPFTIRFEEPVDGHYPATAEFQGIRRRQEIPVAALELNAVEQARIREWLEHGRIHTRAAEDLGSRLFHFLFWGEFLVMFREARQRLGDREPLSLVLDLPLPSSLRDLPWELVYDPQGGHGYLARSRSATLMRRVGDVPFPRDPPAEGHLRILVVTALPQDCPGLRADEEAEAIGKILSGGLGLGDTLRLLARHLFRPRLWPQVLRHLRQGRRFEVTTLHSATRQDLEDCIGHANRQDRGYHVIHFIGHGEDGTTLLLERREDRKADPVSAEEFAMLAAGPPATLVVLNACQSAASGQLFENVAQRVIKHRVPAVIGMQLSVLDRVALHFARDFYRAWAAGEPLERAVGYARRLAPRLSRGAAGDWCIPVLYVAGTQELRPRSLKRVHRWPLATRLVSLLGALIVILGGLSTILDVPDLVRRLQTEVPGLRCLAPYPMRNPDSFNVIVAPLPVVDEQGSRTRGQDGRALARFLYQRMALVFEQMDLQTDYELRPPDHACVIKGNTSEDRRDAAQRLAEATGAHLVIYGQVVAAGENSRYSPEFYVDYKGAEAGTYAAGPHALGSDLYLELPFQVERYQGVRELALSERIEALSYLTVGMSHLFSDDAQGALDHFQRAAATTGWSPDGDGRAVIHLFLGNAHIARTRRGWDPGALQEARADYEQALALKPGYARAISGLSNVLYLLALGDPTDREVSPTLLAEAQATAEALLEVSGPEASEAQPTAHYMLGKIYYLWAGLRDGDWLDRASASFGHVIDHYQIDQEPRWAELAGHAHAGLAAIASYDRRWPDAALEYKAAIELVSPYYQADYLARLGEAFDRQNAGHTAVEAYRRALRTAVFYCEEEQAERYHQRLRELEDKYGLSGDSG